MNVICLICSGQLEVDGVNSFTECGHLFHTACLPRPPPNRSSLATHVVKCRACQHPYNLATVRRLYTQSHANLSVSEDLETLRANHSALVEQRDQLLRESVDLKSQAAQAKAAEVAAELRSFELVDQLADRDSSLERVERELGSMRRYVQRHRSAEQLDAELADVRQKCAQMTAGHQGINALQLDEGGEADVRGTMRAGYSRRRLEECVREEKRRLDRSLQAQGMERQKLQLVQLQLQTSQRNAEQRWRPQQAELAALLAEAKMRRKQLIQERTMMPQPTASSPFAVRAVRRQTVAWSTHSPATPRTSGATVNVSSGGAGGGSGRCRQWAKSRRATDWMEAPAPPAKAQAVGQRPAAGPMARSGLSMGGAGAGDGRLQRK